MPIEGVPIKGVPIHEGSGHNNILAVALEQRLHEVVGSQPPVVLAAGLNQVADGRL